MHYWLLHCMVMHNSLYKLSWKWLSSITKMGEIERTCGAPMFGFGNWWQSLWTNGCLELYLKVLSIGFSLSTCVGFKESWCRPRCYSRNYQKIGHVAVCKFKWSITKRSNAWSLPSIVVTMDLWRCAEEWLTHSGVWGSNQLVFIEPTQSRKVVQFEEVKIVII